MSNFRTYRVTAMAADTQQRRRRQRLREYWLTHFPGTYTALERDGDLSAVLVILSASSSDSNENGLEWLPAAPRDPADIATWALEAVANHWRFQWPEVYSGLTLNDQLDGRLVEATEHALQRLEAAPGKTRREKFQHILQGECRPPEESAGVTRRGRSELVASVAQATVQSAAGELAMLSTASLEPDRNQGRGRLRGVFEMVWWLSAVIVVLQAIGPWLNPDHRARSVASRDLDTWVSDWLGWWPVPNWSAIWVDAFPFVAGFCALGLLLPLIGKELRVSATAKPDWADDPPARLI